MLILERFQQAVGNLAAHDRVLRKVGGLLPLEKRVEVIEGHITDVRIGIGELFQQRAEALLYLVFFARHGGITSGGVGARWKGRSQFVKD